MMMMNKNISIVLLFIFIILPITNLTYATNLPALPPPLPQEQSEAKQDESEPKESFIHSFIEKIKGFFSSKNQKVETVTTDTSSSHATSNTEQEEDNEPFIDLGNTKLPSVSDDKTETFKIPSIKDETPIAPNTPSTEIVKKPEIKPAPTVPVVTSSSKPEQGIPVVTAPPTKTEQGTPVVTESSKPEQIASAPINKVLPKTPAATAPPTTNNNLSNPPQFVAKKPLPKASEPEHTTKHLVIKQKNKSEFSPQQLDPEQLKFVEDETKVLSRPNDDVVLGKITEQAQLELMSSWSYLHIFDKLQEQVNTMALHNKVLSFIHNYDEMFGLKLEYSTEELAEADTSAFVAVDKNNLFDLRTLIDNYPILQMTNDSGYTLLHEASKNDNYTLAKFLIMRGININAVDSDNNTALEISEKLNNSAVYNLLTRAGGS